jgi:hypothetical protein
MFERPLPYTMAGARTVERRVQANDRGTPYLNASSTCRPPGQFLQMDLNFPFQIFQSEIGLELVFREYHGRWNIAYDAAMLPAGSEYMGSSVAHWDGNVLVVETTGLKERFWVDVRGTPGSREARMVHRIRKVDHGDRQPYLEVSVTITDPVNYTNPWTVIRRYGWYPHGTLFPEYNCEEQIGDPNVPSDAGLIPEPRD